MNELKGVLQNHESILQLVVWTFLLKQLKEKPVLPPLMNINRKSSLAWLNPENWHATLMIAADKYLGPGFEKEELKSIVHLPNSSARITADRIARELPDVLHNVFVNKLEKYHEKGDFQTEASLQQARSQFNEVLLKFFGDNHLELYGEVLKDMVRLTPDLVERSKALYDKAIESTTKCSTELEVKVMDVRYGSLIKSISSSKYHASDLDLGLKWSDISKLYFTNDVCSDTTEESHTPLKKNRTIYLSNLPENVTKEVLIESFILAGIF